MENGSKASFRCACIGGALLALVALVAVAVGQERTARRLRAQLAIRQRQQLELASLVAENRRLAARRPAAEEMARLTRLAAERGGDGSRQQPRALAGAREAEAAKALPAEPGERIEAADWKFAGQATPNEAFESVVWAASHQDLDQLAPLLNFTPETRSKLEAFFAQLPGEVRQQYGNPERIAATLLAANLPANLSAIEPLSESVHGDQATVLMAVERSEDAPKTTFLNFQRGPAGWQLLVPDGILAAYRKQLDDPPRALPAEVGAGTP